MTVKHTRTTTIQETSSIVCDACGVTAEADSMEAQEFLSYSSVGGYASVFGDGARVNVDLCQHCFKSLLGSAIHVT